MDNLEVIEKINELHTDIRVIGTKLEILQSDMENIKSKVFSMEEKKQIFSSKIILSLIGGFLAVCLAFLVELSVGK